MTTFPIGNDFIYNLVSSTSFGQLTNGSQGELLPRSWPAQDGLLELLPGFSSLTPLLNQTSPVSVRTWPAEGFLNLLPGFSSLTPLLNQTSPVSARSFSATSTLNLDLPNSPTCGPWPTLPTTGQIWPLDNNLYNYVAYIFSFSPTTLTAGSGIVTLDVNGQNFTAGATATVDGNATPLTFVSTSQVTLEVDTDALAAGTPTVAITTATGTATKNITVEPPPLLPYLLAAFNRTGYNVSDNVGTARSAFDIAPILGDCQGQSTSLSQDGVYLAFLSATGDAVWAYKRNGNGWSKMTVVDVPQAADVAGGVSISPDGNCLIMAYDWNYNSGTPIYIWNRNGLTWENRTVLAANSKDIGVATTLVWTNDSQYLAGCEWAYGTQTPRIWKNVAGTLTPLTVPAASGWVSGLAWHPSGNYLIAILSRSVNPVLYSRSGDTFTIVGSIADYTGGNKAVVWSADGNTLFLGGSIGYENPFSGVKPYDFNGSTFTPLPTNYTTSIGYNLYMLPGSSTELWDGSENNRLSFASGTLESLGGITGVSGFVRSWALAHPTPVAPFANISSFSPTTLTAGSGIVTLTVNGQNFTAGATALVGEDLTPLTFVSAGQVTLDVDTDLLLAGTVGISINTTNGTAAKDITVEPPPLPIPLPNLWLDASNPGDVSVDGSNLVTSWADRLNGDIYAPTTPTDGPTLVSSGINGLPTLQWPSVNSNANLLRSLGSSTLPCNTIYMVAQWLGPSGFSYRNCLFSDGAGNNKVWGNPFQTGLWFSNGYFPEVMSANGGPNLYPNLDFTSTLPNPTLVKAGRTNNNSTVDLINTIGIGCDAEYPLGQKRGWCGYIGEVIMYSSALTPEEETQVIDYLTNKWLPY